MTCIVGIADKKTVWMGADSAGASNWDLVVRKDAKVFTNGPFLIGFTTSFRMGQLLRWSFTPPRHPKGLGLERFMHTLFVDAVRKCLEGGGYQKTENGRQSGGTFLVGYQGRLFAICDDYQVAEARCGFDACGCGDQVARGALRATAGRPAKERLSTALAAAEEFSAGVRRPFRILSVGPK